MSKLKELMDVSKLVEITLINEPQTRNSDNLLYLRILAVFAEDKGINLKNISVANFLENSKKMGFPNFETVRRTRQKVQAENEHLKGDRKVRKERKKNEATFRDFARN